MTQIFLSAGKRGAALDGDARVLLARLRADATPPAAAARLGDPFVSGTTFQNASRAGLAKIFGADLAAAVSALPAGHWSEPIASPYGLHIVQVTDRDAADLPTLDAVRSRVLRAYRAERRAQYLSRMMDALRTAYEVRVDRHG